MPRIEPVVQALTEPFDNPIDRLAEAVIALAIYDATNDIRRKTIRNNSLHIKHYHQRRLQARQWLQNHGIYWLEALDLQPELILEAIYDD
jgi:hypothetical protein